jgi:acyl carrier protein
MRRSKASGQRPRDSETATPGGAHGTVGPMTSEDIMAQLRELMIDVFDVDDLQITPATSAEDVEEWDSLSHVRLVVAVERKFGIKFKNSEIEGLKSVGDLVNLIEAKSQ